MKPKLQKQFLEGRRESFQKPKFTSLDTQQAYAERAAMYQRKLMQKVPTYREFQKVGKGAAGLIGAFGLSTQGGYKAARRPVGRPRKTYLHGMPIQQWKQLQSQRGQVMQLAQMQQEQDLVKRGYSPQQIENIRLQRMAQERMNPSRQPASMEEYVQQNTVSPNTMMMLERINQIHQKGQVDNARMQRIVRERRMIQDATDLMKAPNMFGPQASTFNILETQNTILQAPNIMLDSNSEHILKKRPISILDTKSVGNQLFF